MYADKETQKKLIDACNLLCEHVAAKLPSGWEIVLEINNDDASLELYSPEGDRIEVATADSGISTLDEMCVTASELDIVKTHGKP